MKVFIVDDEEISLFITKRKMILEGLAEQENITTFLFASDALEALSICKNEELPDVLLLDLSMPVMDGWRFLEMLAPLKPKMEGRCRIYILTSSLALSDKEKAGGYTMLSGFIQKPITEQDIRILASGGILAGK